MKKDMQIFFVALINDLYNAIFFYFVIGGNLIKVYKTKFIII